MNDEVLFSALQLEERPGTPLYLVTYTAYRRLLVQARAMGYPHLLRVWNYFSSHIGTVSDILKEGLPSHTQVLYLQGEMCRSELLLEIEGILGQEKTIDVSQTVSPTRVRPRQPATSQHAQPDSFKTA